MPSFDNYHASKRIRSIIAGASGSGKTTLIAELVNNGYNVRVLDIDIGLDILDSYIKPECRKNLIYATVPMLNPKSWDEATRLTIHWKTPTEDLGRVDTWTEREVLVIDTATFWSYGIEPKVLSEDLARKKDATKVEDIAAYNINLRQVMNTYIEDQIARLANLKCNVVLFTHLKEIEDKNKRVTMLPDFFGKYLPRTIPKYFNDVYVLEDRKILTRGNTIYPFIKSSAPQALQEKEDANLATLFAKILAFRGRNTP